ncbi:winged helix-turn-helix domain-containing protein [Enterococcus sp. BWB1-3]|uniref:winged helix-turn-helix domain-containing protein n=1 Tax=Enterococcus sp. BWB1-3 TaxID=2787713 RepID=UPI0019226958|nr:helix-turn-helix domain-containing protein [Enterococcus sp. BWB1-3]MBL1228264.1 winged helix-turn-helix domain-containing protein [Enterococcus sp. BWB1-3]
MNVGVISLSIKLEESYSEELKKNDINVVSLTIEDFEKRESECDGLIICEDAVKDMARTCSILLKLKKKPNALVWIFSPNLQKSMRSIYLQLGALGTMSEDYESGELQLFIANNLNKHKVSRVYGIDYSTLSEETTAATKKIQLIPRNQSVKINGEREILLTRLEYKTIELLYERKNSTVTYKELFKLIWNEGFNDEKHQVANNEKHRVANLVFRLREKIEADVVKPEIILTVRSQGYMLSLKE